MIRVFKVLARVVVFLTVTPHAHFLLNDPPTIGFDDDLETTPPCGSFSVDFSTDNVTDFHVGGDSIALTSIHPQATWLFRATLGQNAVTSNWTTLLPAIVQLGLGAFCEKSVIIPAAWAGSKGILQIVQDAPDGVLYQCAAVNFVSGVGKVKGDCSNVTGLTASYTTDSVLSNLPTNAPSSAASGPATGTSAAPASTSTSSAAGIVTPSYSNLGSILFLTMVISATFVGFLL